ncbi:conserved hypothetical protein, partial [Listeria innocua FSL S4-378]
MKLFEEIRFFWGFSYFIEEIKKQKPLLEEISAFSTLRNAIVRCFF